VVQYIYKGRREEKWKWRQIYIRCNGFFFFNLVFMCESWSSPYSQIARYYIQGKVFSFLTWLRKTISMLRVEINPPKFFSCLPSQISPFFFGFCCFCQRTPLVFPLLACFSNKTWLNALVNRILSCDQHHFSLNCQPFLLFLCSSHIYRANCQMIKRGSNEEPWRQQIKGFHCGADGLAFHGSN